MGFGDKIRKLKDKFKETLEEIGGAFKRKFSKSRSVVENNNDAIEMSLGLEDLAILYLQGDVPWAERENRRIENRRINAWEI